MATILVRVSYESLGPHSHEAAGRDWLVERAVSGGYWKGRWWKADVEWRTDLIQEGSDGKFSITLPSLRDKLI